MKKIIIIFLACILLVGLVLSMANTTDYLVNKITKPSNESKEEEEQISPLIANLTTYDFDGETSELLNDESSDYYVEDKFNIWTIDNDCLELKTSGKYDDSEDNVANESVYFKEELNFVDYRCIIIDFDVFDINLKMSNGNDENFVVCVNDIDTKYNNGIFAYGLGSDNYNIENDIDDSHWTIVFTCNGNYYFYIDGVFVYEGLAGFDMSKIYNLCFCYYGYQYGTSLKIDNIKINSISFDYEGAIKDLLDNPYVDLSTNPDTVLGGGY